MTKIDTYRQALAGLPDWDAYLLAESGLPGPRGNLELAAAVADAGDEPLFRRYVALDAGTAPANTPAEFLAFCGALGLGRLAAEAAGERRAALLADLRRLAADDMQGRETGTPGYERAAAFVAAQMADAGLEPAGEGGTWFQRVPLLTGTPLRDGARLAVERLQRSHQGPIALFEHFRRLPGEQVHGNPRILRRRADFRRNRLDRSYPPQKLN